jgi:hypothetical protein
MRNRKTILQIAGAVLILSIAGASMMARHIDRLRGPAKVEEVMYVRSPKLIKFLSLGYTGLAADIYWTRAVQYFGGHHQQQALRYDLLKPLLDLTTELDPHLIVAYEFGFIHYIEREDYKAAAEAFQRGSEVPGAHPWMKVMAATMSSRGGDIQTARFLWTKIYESSDDKQIRQNALLRLVALRVDEDLTHLEALVQDYKQRTGSYPADWQQLISAGMLRGVPADPSGAPYRLMPDGAVLVEDSHRFPFIRKGLPKGERAPEIITPEAYRPAKRS